MMVFRAAALHLDHMQREGFLSQHAWETLKPELLERTEQMALMCVLSSRSIRSWPLRSWTAPGESYCAHNAVRCAAYSATA